MLFSRGVEDVFKKCPEDVLKTTNVCWDIKSPHLKSNELDIRICCAIFINKRLISIQQKSLTKLSIDHQSLIFIAKVLGEAKTTVKHKFEFEN